MKPVIGYEDEYSVTEDGRIFRMLNRRGGVRKPYDPPLEMKPRTNAQGYLCVSLCKDGKVSNRRVSRLVLEAYKGSPASQFLVAAHLDGNKLNNHFNNLDWVTYEENESHKRAHGTTGNGEKNGFAKLSDNQIVEIRRLAALGKPKASIVRQFGVSRSAINQIVNGQSRNDDPHYFKKMYLEAIAREKVLLETVDLVQSMTAFGWQQDKLKALLKMPSDSTALDSAIRQALKPLYDFVGRDYAHLKPKAALELWSACIIRQAKREALLEAAEIADDMDWSDGVIGRHFRNMAKELEEQ
jgi:hypothetical protein